jgi:hypothetical protein
MQQREPRLAAGREAEIEMRETAAPGRFPHETSCPSHQRLMSSASAANGSAWTIPVSPCVLTITEHCPCQGLDFTRSV